MSEGNREANDVRGNAALRSGLETQKELRDAAERDLVQVDLTTEEQTRSSRVVDLLDAITAGEEGHLYVECGSG